MKKIHKYGTEWTRNHFGAFRSSCLMRPAFIGELIRILRISMTIVDETSTRNICSSKRTEERAPPKRAPPKWIVSGPKTTSWCHSPLPISKKQQWLFFRYIRRIEYYKKNAQTPGIHLSRKDARIIPLAYFSNDAPPVSTPPTSAIPVYL